MKISGEKIAIENDSKITIYNHRFLNDNKIDVSLFKKKQTIKSLCETKDRNIICACEEGDIFKHKIEKKNVQLLAHFHLMM